MLNNAEHHLLKHLHVSLTETTHAKILMFLFLAVYSSCLFNSNVDEAMF